MGAATDETATVERGIGETDGAVLKTEDEKTEDEKTAVEITDDDENADLVPAPASSGFSVLFCRLYFIATSGVCLFRSGTVGFQKKLQSQKKKLCKRRMTL